MTAKFYPGIVCFRDTELPLVALPGVTDAYPPQKKSFMMMKYLHDYGKQSLSTTFQFQFL